MHQHYRIATRLTVPGLRDDKRWLAVLVMLVWAAAILVVGSAVAARAQDGPKPCDLYGRAGTPCVAAHSTTRALYAGYGGPLYRVERRSDGASRDIGLQAPGGTADAATQDRVARQLG